MSIYSRNTRASIKFLLQDSREVSLETVVSLARDGQRWGLGLEYQDVHRTR